MADTAILGMIFQFTPLREGRLHPGHKVVAVGAISIHAPPRGATGLRVAQQNGRTISIHAPPRGATVMRCTRTPRDKFQFTPLREGRLERWMVNFIRHISIHAPPRGATFFARKSRTFRCAFQFTPLREGRLATNNDEVNWSFISIHAPPRGATAEILNRTSGNEFQFTPLREGRLCRFSQPTPSFYFNSRPSARGDKPPTERGNVWKNFNSRPSARGDPSPSARSQSQGHFNSRPSARGDNVGVSVLEIPASFQFTPLREGRPLRKSHGYIQNLFQFTPLREGRQAARPGTADDMRFQFTPLREGRPGVSFSCLLWLSISIHAPPRGATSRRKAATTTDPISIHAPPRGATQYIFSSSAKSPISIHAPPRGATRQRPPRPTIAMPFQFTPLREGRRHCRSGRCRPAHFNSRPSARGDQTGHRRVQRVHISIHAPPRGATGRWEADCCGRYFNSRPSARGDLPASKHITARKIFQFTPLREGRPPENLCPSAQNISIHAPPRGATRTRA